jgi:hypothetical protein
LEASAAQESDGKARAVAAKLNVRPKREGKKGANHPMWTSSQYKPPLRIAVLTAFPASNCFPTALMANRVLGAAFNLNTVSRCTTAFISMQS